MQPIINSMYLKTVFISYKVPLDGLFVKYGIKVSGIKAITNFSSNECYQL